MTEHITITKKKPSELQEPLYALDYEYLRRTGLKYIEQLAKSVWTDYNIHDPGITIMELLSYTITDLSYRTNHPIEDILSVESNNNKYFHNQFISAIKILPVRPVSENDLRKLFIDINSVQIDITITENSETGPVEKIVTVDLGGVKNAWIFKGEEQLNIDSERKQFTISPADNNTIFPIHLNGLYDIRLELEEIPEQEFKVFITKEIQKEGIIKAANAKYQQNRNLCEDIRSIDAINEHEIIVCADIDLQPGAKPDVVWAEIIHSIKNYLSPEVIQYSLKDMLDRKDENGNPYYSTDVIFEGPCLENGFIDDDELTASKLKSEIYTSDLINIIMDIKDIKAVKNIFLNYCHSEIPSENHKWSIKINTGEKPTLCMTKTNIDFFVDVLPLQLNKITAVKNLSAIEISQNEKRKLIKTEDLPMPVGTYRNLTDHTSIVHLLPQNYGVGIAGLPNHASDERKAQAKQLKAYLLFYDQLFTNYFAQLNNVKQLFIADNTIKKTYFTQIIPDDEIPEMKSLYTDFDGRKIDLDLITEELDPYESRKNRLLDHLLGRFAETFNDYALQLYSLEGNISEKNVIDQKVRFLKDYPSISKNRSGGYDLSDIENIWQTTNVSGLEHRICRLLGIEDYSRRHLFTYGLTRNSYFDFFHETIAADNTSTWHFTFIDKTNSAVLLTSVNYANQSICETEFYKSLCLARNKSNYKFITNAEGVFTFELLNESGLTVATSPDLFETQLDREIALNNLLGYIKSLQPAEGLFAVEHILLRPDRTWLSETSAINYFMPVSYDEDCEEDCGSDPYSFRVSIILPANAQRFQNFEFRTYIEKLIRLETPAHIQPKICWAGDDDICKFELEYQNWLNVNQNTNINPTVKQQYWETFITMLFNIKSIYPEGNLFDCKLEDQQHIFITGRTNLGTQNN